jgi:uncharacterized protein YcbX
VSSVTVRALSTTPVKGTRLHAADHVVLDAAGAQGDRRFYVIDGRDRMVNAKQLGELTALVAKYSEEGSQLQIAFPDDRIVEGEIRLGETVNTRFYSESAVAQVVDGPWSGALSDYAGQSLRLVQAADGGAVDRGAYGGVTLISTASLRKLAEVADRDAIDARRFRMLVEIDGVDAHAEDRWVGRWARIGEATVRFHGHVGRCLITSRDPETGRIDVPTLDILGRYRGGLNTTEPLPFGIYGAVVKPGVVRVADPVLPEG